MTCKHCRTLNVPPPMAETITVYRCIGCKRINVNPKGNLECLKP
jgi:hypothetical protein